MRTLFKILALVILVISINSCGINYAVMVNENHNATQVHLTENNYTIVEKVTGQADVSYILLIGGIKKKQLYENAYAQMVNSANLMTGSKALVNVITEDHMAGFPPFYTKRTITVSAHVIEFNR